MIADQAALIALISSYSFLILCSVILILRASCRSLQFSKTQVGRSKIFGLLRLLSSRQVVIFAVFLCATLRAALFASLLNPDSSNATEVKRFFFDFPGLLSFSVFSIYFVEIYSIVFKIIKWESYRLRSNLLNALVFANLLVYSVEIILVTSPDAFNKFCAGNVSGEAFLIIFGGFFR